MGTSRRALDSPHFAALSRANTCHASGDPGHWRVKTLSLKSINQIGCPSFAPVEIVTWLDLFTRGGEVHFQFGRNRQADRGQRTGGAIGARSRRPISSSAWRLSFRETIVIAGICFGPIERHKAACWCKCRRAPRAPASPLPRGRAKWFGRRRHSPRIVKLLRRSSICAATLRAPQIASLTLYAPSVLK